MNPQGYRTPEPAESAASGKTKLNGTAANGVANGVANGTKTNGVANGVATNGNH